MSNIQYYNTDEALKFILAPGSDSEMKIWMIVMTWAHQILLLNQERQTMKIIKQILMHPIQRTNLKPVKTRDTMTITNNQ